MRKYLPVPHVTLQTLSVVIHWKPSHNPWLHTRTLFGDNFGFNSFQHRDSSTYLPGAPTHNTFGLCTPEVGYENTIDVNMLVDLGLKKLDKQWLI